LRPNGRRQDYIRTKLKRDGGMLIAEPFGLQDSSMQKVFAQSDGLIVRALHAPGAKAGDEVQVLLLDGC
jgi:molybdopterin molybdotransferase